MADLLGGKGANLAEMSGIGLPVPPGFTVTTEVCTWYYDNGRTYPDGLAGQVDAGIAGIESDRRPPLRRSSPIRCWSPSAPAPAPLCPA